MSRETILRLITRMEHIANKIAGASKQERTSLMGQVLGTLRAIKDEFSMYGIPMENDEFADSCFALSKPSTDDIIMTIHEAAAYCRGLAERLK